MNEAYETCLLEGDESTLIGLIEKTGKRAVIEIIIKFSKVS